MSLSYLVPDTGASGFMMFTGGSQGRGEPTRSRRTGIGFMELGTWEGLMGTLVESFVVV